MKKIYLSLIILGLFIVSCGEVEQKQIDLNGKLFQFKVEVLQAPDTSEISPADIPYNEDDFKVKIKITAQDYYGNTIKDFKNNIKLSTSTGECKPANLSGSSFTNGVATTEVSLIKTFGPSFIIAEDSKNGVIGVSDESKIFYFKELSIYDIQLPKGNSPDSENYFNDSYIRISENTDSDGSNAHHNLMVIHASGSGMYIIDTDKLHVNGGGDNSGACMIKDANGNWVKNPDFKGYSTIYVYSRNAPVNFDGDTSVGASEEDFKYLRAGHRLKWFSGNLVEFPPGVPNGMTEMGFPLWQMIDGEMDLDDQTLDERLKDIPICKLEHSDFVTGRSDAEHIVNLEKYESNLVEIRDVQIGDFDADNKDYKIYSQWQVYPIGTDLNAPNKPTFRVVSINGASEFDLMFKDNTIHKGTEIEYVRGILHQVYGNIWVIYLRNKCDIRLKDDSLGGWNQMIDNDPECNKQ